MLSTSFFLSSFVILSIFSHVAHLFNVIHPRNSSQILISADQYSRVVIVIVIDRARDKIFWGEEVFLLV